MLSYLEKHKYEENIKDFKVSDPFIHNFKKRNHISLRMSHPKRRSDSNQEITLQSMVGQQTKHLWNIWTLFLIYIISNHSIYF